MKILIYGAGVLGCNLATFACYKTDGNLKKLKGNTAYLNRLIDANIEGYRAIQNAGQAHKLGPVVALSNLSNNLSQTLASGGEDGKRKSVVIQKFEILRNSKRNLLTNMLDVLQ